MNYLKNNRIIRAIISRIKRFFLGQPTRRIIDQYYKKFNQYAFIDCSCTTKEQFEASITRLYHTIEKGLSYDNYRPGFGPNNVKKLVQSLEQYVSKKYDTNTFFYETALSCLHEYVKKNRLSGLEDSSLENRLNKLIGQKNNLGGTISVSYPFGSNKFNYEQLVTSRHSIRHFSNKPVDMKLLTDAIKLAQYTPSACNRQGWKTKIIKDRDLMAKILDNQNGNRGFGQEFDKLLVITSDLRAQQKDREIFQAFIDGGMYAESILNALFFKGIGSVPLSASLLPEQEKKVREYAKLEDAEILILFIGIGNYPEKEFLTTRSERKPIAIESL